MRKELLQLFALGLFFSSPLLSSGQWNQLGSSIHGSQEGEQSGRVVSLNGDGTVLSIGVPGHDVVGGNEGQGEVRIFSLENGSWSQKGDDLNGSGASDYFGYATALNESGDVVIIGDPQDWFLGGDGYARVYEWEGEEWNQVGGFIQGNGGSDSFGADVDMSADGSIVAVRAEPPLDSCYVKVFLRIDDSWSQLGDDIVGPRSSAELSRSIRLSQDGQTIAIGYPYFLVDGEDFVGLLRVFQWDGENWLQKGGDLVGENAQDHFGAAISMDADGAVIAVGGTNQANGGTGYFKVFEWDGSEWMQKGVTIYGEEEDERIGAVHDLNSSGDKMVVTSFGPAIVKIYDFENDEWIESGIVMAQSETEAFGASLSFNSQGDVFAVGAPYNSIEGFGTGRVIVYENGTTLGVPEVMDELNRVAVFPNPASSFIQLKGLHQPTEVRLFDLSGKQIFTLYAQRDGVVDVSEIPSGAYLLQLQTGTSTRSELLIKQ
jgi:hypothetical protein